MRFSSALVAMAVTAVSAQQTTQNYTSSLDMEINAGSVDPSLRSDWCTAQENTCDTLCGADTEKNDCVDATLKWECECSSNSSAPGLQYYTQTVPTFICQQLLATCIQENDASQRGQRECKENIETYCATQSPPEDVVSSDDDDSDDSTATDTATGSATESTADSTATEESVTSTSSDGFAAPTMAPAGKGAAAAIAIGMLAYLV
ncbi:hypothetical protein FZEAL_6053 [Fusarium zealandicum]|uniref:DUF7707 domain-containing protein n=1 Tax=Fusarium zealandicum TaxID=1053134 RepID=A0A8H4UJF5_9HYPO|nr:hypothetical protein FZEAL_6053 [Fusarium zealandicum]